MDPSLSEVGGILREYDLGRLQSMHRLHSGYANLNYRLVTERREGGGERREGGRGNIGEFLLRICMEKPEQDILYEMNVLEHLRRIDFPAAYPIRRRDGAFISSHPQGAVVISEFIQGSEPDSNERTVREIARAVALLNSLEGWEGRRKENALGLDLCRNVISAFDTAPCRYPGIFDYFKHETDQLEEALREEVPQGLIHGDVFPDNTIFRGNILMAILDWEEVCTDRLLIDLGVTINGFCFLKNRLDEKLMDTFLESYQEIRKLSEKELELLPYYIRWGAHAMIAWHLKYLIIRKDPRKMERVRMFMDRLKKLEKI